MKKILLVLLSILLVTVCRAEAGIPLRDLEAALTASPEVLSAAASLSESRALEERQRLAGGPRFFGELSLSGLNEPLSRSGTSAIEGYRK
ncbi:MAG: hypothetical protein ACOYJV_05920, partial [Aminivibrio sp.]